MGTYRRCYAGSYPATASAPFTHISRHSVRSSSDGTVCFGIVEAKPVVVNGGSGFRVSGSDNRAEWQDPKYAEFLTYVGQAMSSRGGKGVQCILWRDQYWIRAVRTDRKPLIRYRNGYRVSYVLLPISVPSDFLQATPLTHLSG
jgi:hypothetical protein